MQQQGKEGKLGAGEGAVRLAEQTQEANGVPKLKKKVI